MSLGSNLSIVEKTDILFRALDTSNLSPSEFCHFALHGNAQNTSRASPPRKGVLRILNEKWYILEARPQMADHVLESKDNKSIGFITKIRQLPASTYYEVEIRSSGDALKALHLQDQKGVEIQLREFMLDMSPSCQAAQQPDVVATFMAQDKKTIDPIFEHWLIEGARLLNSALPTDLNDVRQSLAATKQGDWLNYIQTYFNAQHEQMAACDGTITAGGRCEAMVDVAIQQAGEMPIYKVYRQQTLDFHADIKHVVFPSLEQLSETKTSSSGAVSPQHSTLMQFPASAPVSSSGKPIEQLDPEQLTLALEEATKNFEEAKSSVSTLNQQINDAKAQGKSPQEIEELQRDLRDWEEVQKTQELAVKLGEETKNVATITQQIEEAHTRNALRSEIDVLQKKLEEAETKKRQLEIEEAERNVAAYTQQIEEAQEAGTPEDEIDALRDKLRGWKGALTNLKGTPVLGSAASNTMTPAEQDEYATSLTSFFMIEESAYNALLKTERSLRQSLQQHKHKCESQFLLRFHRHLFEAYLSELNLLWQEPNVQSSEEHLAAIMWLLYYTQLPIFVVKLLDILLKELNKTPTNIQYRLRAIAMAFHKELETHLHTFLPHERPLLSPEDENTVTAWVHAVLPQLRIPVWESVAEHVTLPSCLHTS